MKRRLLARLLISSLILGGTSFVTSATAQETSSQLDKFAWPPLKPAESYSASQLLGYRFGIEDNYVSSAIFGESNNYIKTFETGQWCNDFSDKECVAEIQASIKSGTNSGWDANILFSKCTSKADQKPCISNLSLEENGALRELAFDRELPSFTWQEDSSSGLPKSGAAQLWIDPKNSDASFRYLVIAGGQFAMDKNNLTIPVKKKFNLLSFQSSVIPTRIYQGDFVPGGITTSADSSKKSWSQQIPTQKPKISSDFNWANICAWIDKGECGYRVEFPEDSRPSLSMRIPNSVGGFLTGRLASPQVTVSSLGKHYSDIRVSAKPVLVPLLHVIVLTKDATEAIKNEARDNYCPDGSCLKGIVGGITSSSYFDYAYGRFSIYEKYFNGKATLMQPVWSVRSQPTTFNSCELGDNIFHGMVTSNASIYSGGPPSYVDGELSFQMAGVRKDVNGVDFLGSYDLLLAQSFVECLYKVRSGQAQATVSITAATGGDIVTTTKVAAINGWYKIAAEGFKFPAPAIKVKLTDSQNSKKSVTSDVKPGLQKRTISCVKGRAIKKVTGVAPKCPIGFKKK